jgi:hypothetical protein
MANPPGRVISAAARRVATVRISVTRASPAAITTLWDALADLPSWPDWCPAFAVVQPDGPLQVGTRVRVVQAELRAATWTVRQVDVGHSFRWSTGGPGFQIETDHRLVEQGSGASVTLTVTVTGPMAWAVTVVSGRTMRRYLDEQADALAGMPNPAA